MPEGCYLKSPTHQIITTESTLSNYAPCGPTNSSVPFVNCCIAGDTCYEDGICRFTDHTVVGASGWYDSGCTDPVYTDKSCFDRCSVVDRGDIINLSGNQWACCGKDVTENVSCGNPSNITFTAPAASTVQPLMVAESTPTTVMQTTTVTATAPAHTFSASLRKTLTSGARAGIGVGVTAGVLAILLLIVIAFRKRRAQRRKGPIATPPPQRGVQRQHYKKPELPVTREHNVSHNPLIVPHRSVEPSGRNAVSGLAPIQLPGHEVVEMDTLNGTWRSS